VTNFGKWILRNEVYQGNMTISRRRTKTSREEDKPVTSILMSRKVEVGSRFKSIAEASPNRIEGKSPVVLQRNCSYSKAIELEFSCHV
jgi:hypothetical protein